MAKVINFSEMAKKNVLRGSGGNVDGNRGIIK